MIEFSHCRHSLMSQLGINVPYLSSHQVSLSYQSTTMRWALSSGAAAILHAALQCIQLARQNSAVFIQV